MYEQTAVAISSANPSFHTYRYAPRKPLHVRGDNTLRAWAAQRQSVAERFGLPSESMLSRIRREGAGAAQSTAPGDLTLIEAQADKYGFVVRVETAVLSLPVEWRRIVVLRYLIDMPREKVASQLSLTLDQVRLALKRAQERVRARLDVLEGKLYYQENQLVA